MSRAAAKLASARPSAKPEHHARPEERRRALGAGGGRRGRRSTGTSARARRWTRARSSRQCRPSGRWWPSLPPRPRQGGASTTDVRVDLYAPGRGGAPGAAAGRPRGRGAAGPRRRQPQGAHAARRARRRTRCAGGGGRARRGAVGRRPAGQAERAGRRAGQPAAGLARAPIGSRATTPATRSSPTGSTSTSSTRASRPPSGRWPTGDAISARMAATMALDLVRGPLAPRGDAPRGSTARARRSSGRSPPPACWPPRRRSCRATRPVPRRWRRAGLDHDPYDEAALRSLMRAHVALGRPASALAAYAEVRARLAEDLGVSPVGGDRGAALGDPPGGARTGRIGGRRRRRPERWDPLVQRARAELADTDFDAARRDAEAAVRRGAGAGALEVAGWVAYYDRDIAGALRFAEEAARTASDDERRTSALTLSGRARHSRGDLAGAERDLEAGGAEPGRRRPRHRRGVARQPAHAPGPVRRGARARRARRRRRRRHAPPVRDPALDVRPRLRPRRHRVGSPRRSRRCAEFDVLVDELGPVGDRYRPVVDNFWGWILGADRPDRRGPRAAPTRPGHRRPRSPSRGTTRCSTWRWPRSRRRTPPPPRRGSPRWRCRRTRPAPWPGTSATASACSRRGSRCSRAIPTTAARPGGVGAIDDAARRGARAARRPGRGGAAPRGRRRAGRVDDAAVDATVARLDDLARLEAWRYTARLAAATGRADLWTHGRALRRAARRRLRPATPTASEPGPAASSDVCDAKTSRCGVDPSPTSGGEDDHAADERFGVGAEEVEGAGFDRGDGRLRAASDERGDLGHAEAPGDEVGGGEVGERDGDRLARWRRGRRRRPTAAPVPPSPARASTSALSSPIHRPATNPTSATAASTAAFTGWASSVGVGRHEDDAARARRPGRLRQRRRSGSGTWLKEKAATTAAQEPTRAAAAGRRPPRPAAARRWSTREHPVGQVERDRATPGPRDGTAGGAGAGADVGDPLRRPERPVSAATSTSASRS